MWQGEKPSSRVEEGSKEGETYEEEGTDVRIDCG